MPPARLKAVVAWTPAVLVCAWAAVRALGLDTGYPLVPLMAYTPYVLGVAVLALALALALRRFGAALAAGLALAVLGFAVAPRMLGDGDGGSGPGLRVMSANVLAGGGDAAQLAELAREREVQVLAVQELTPGFAAGLEAAGINALLPHSALEARDGVRGTGIYSSLPLRQLPPVPGEFAQARARAGPEPGLEVVSVHPPPPTGPGATERWEEGLASLPRPAHGGGRLLLLGDFNSTLDNSAFRALLGDGFTDAGEAAGAGLVPTWPALDRELRYLPVTIDHLLAEGEEVGVRDYEVLDIDGTDHRPVYAELVLG